METTPVNKSISIVNWVAIVLSIIAVVASLLLWQATHNMHESLHHNNLTWEQTAQQLQLTLATQKQHDEAINTLQKSIEELEANRDNLAATQAVGEARYLIRLANLHLQFEHDVDTSVALLQLAKERLDKSNTTEAIQLKLTLGQDINNLAQLPRINVVGILTSLDQLNSKISELPTTPEAPTISSNTSADDSQHTWWKRIEHNLAGLKDFIVIRHLNEDSESLVTPEQLSLVQENMQAKISMAQWAVLHEKTQLYQTSLNTIKEWLQEYYESNPTAIAISKQIDQLIALPVALPLQNVTQTPAPILSGAKP